MLNKRFQEMYGNVGTECRDTSSSFQTICKRYVNDGYDEILRRLIQADMFEQFRTFTLTAVAGTRSYSAPYDMGEIVYCVDTTNGRDLSIVTQPDIYQKQATRINTTGVPFEVVLRADSMFRSQPSASSQIDLFSSSSGDTTQTMLIRGISGSAEFYETLTYNGTTTATSSNSYDYLIEAVKSATTTGKSTIVYRTDGAIASIISPESYFERFKVLEFYFVPAGAYTYSIRYRRVIKPMSQDNDVPAVDGIANGIEAFAISRAWKYKRQFATASQWMNDFEAWYTEYVTERSKGQCQQFDIMPYPRDSY